MGARIWTHFYEECPEELASQNDTSFSSQPSAAATMGTITATVLTSSVDVRAGQCVAVPINSTEKAEAGSISIESKLTIVQPFQTCNVTVHEVPDCVDPPLIIAPVMNSVAKSECVPRNFRSFNDVWVRLDCQEIGTGTAVPTGTVMETRRRFHNTISRNRPIRRIAESKWKARLGQGYEGYV
jgi:hypothetical protein